VSCPGPDTGLVSGTGTGTSSNGGTGTNGNCTGTNNNGTGTNNNVTGNQTGSGTNNNTGTGYSGGTSTVTFNSNGGSYAPPQYVSAGGKAAEPHVTRPGYILDGWYMNEALTNRWNFATDVVSSSLTLYAKWNTGGPASGLVEMAYVPGGSFQMGDAGYDYSSPVHTVTLTGFYMGKYEVTQGQWQAVMGSNPASSYGVGANYPVYNVSWYDAVEFCNSLSEREGLTKAYTISGSTVTANWSASGYRLPTEAQWEYAAKGGNGSPGNYTYSGSNTVGDVAWYSGNNSPYGAKEVGTKAANGLGIYDMSGNVWEWCWDWYGSYSSGAQTDPVGASSGSDRVLRGGNWFYSAENVRSAPRYSYYPYFRYDYLGFRLARP
jgi:uncharacterized repeat protein (TIGR02543 family)